jgi:hypothetical protein
VLRKKETETAVNIPLGNPTTAFMPRLKSQRLRDTPGIDPSTVIKRLVRTLKNAMKQLELSPPSTDGITWRRTAAWINIASVQTQSQKSVPHV